MPVLTDIHESYQAEIVAEVDVLQIPPVCRRSRPAAGCGRHWCAVNVKRGSFWHPGTCSTGSANWRQAVRKTFS